MNVNDKLSALAAKKRKKSGFQLAPIRDKITSCAETLFKAIRRQNPKASLDQLEEDLRKLVVRHGTPDGHFSQQPTTASENVLMPYNLCGDVLALAAEAYDKKHYKEALAFFTTAMDADDRNVLLEAINNMNAHTAQGIEAEELDDSDNSGTEDDENDNDEDQKEDDGDLDSSMEEQVAALEVDADDLGGDDDVGDDGDENVDNDEEENLDEDPDADPYGQDAIMSGFMGSADPEESNDLDDEEENLDDKWSTGNEDPDAEDDGSSDDPTIPMNSASSRKTIKAKLNNRILRNKISLSGTQKDKERSSSLRG